MVGGSPTVPELGHNAVAKLLKKLVAAVRTRTYDLRIMSCPPGADSKEIQQDDSAEHGKTVQDTQPPRNQEH
jgi:hypothetical protein